MVFDSVIFQYASLGDYLFLILVIIASIIQAFTQNRKKKALQDRTPKPIRTADRPYVEVLEKKPETMKGYESPLDNIFDSIERVLTPEVEEENYEWEDDNSEAVTNEKIAKQEEEDMVRLMEQKKPLTTEPFNTVVPQEKDVRIPANKYKTGIRANFSLRKAVVYSEILNRKYS